MAVDFSDLIDLFSLNELERLKILSEFLKNTIRDLLLALEGKIMMSELQ